MHFLSFSWVAWMGGTVALYWLMPRGWRDHALIAITAGFLVVHAPDSALILCAFAVATYTLSRAPGPLGGFRTLALAAGIVAVLGYYKLSARASPEDLMRETVIPLGLSYYSFRCVHYLIERYRGSVSPPRFSEFLSYLFFIPTIVVGPIHRVGTFLTDLRRKRWDAQMLSEGLERILYGYVKIAVLGGYLVSGHLARLIATLDPADQPLALYLDTVRGGLSIYLQFSGFSDVAIGFARLLGYRVIENFDWPYLQRNISDFWRCWHISLSSWCREYIYTTVFALTRNPALGALSTMVVIGLWHEISLRYIVWGIYHGLGIVAWQSFQKLRATLPTVRSRVLRGALDGLSIALTVHFVWLSFVIVRQPDLASAFDVLATMLLFWR